MTSTHAPTLTARTVAVLVREAIGTGNAKASTGSQIERDGDLVTVSVRVIVHGAAAHRNGETSEEYREILARAVAAAATRAGYEVSRSGSILTVTLPEPTTDEPVIVRAGQAAPLAQHDAPRQDLDGEFRETAHGLRYLTAEEVAAESARRAAAGEPVATLAELEETVAALTPAAAEVTAAAREVVGEALTPYAYTRSGSRGFSVYRDGRFLGTVVEVGSVWLLGGAEGAHAGPVEFATRDEAAAALDEPAVDDDPREEPAPLEWSGHAGS